MDRTCRLLFAGIVAVTLAGCGGGGPGGPPPPTAILSVSQTSVTFNTVFGGSSPAPMAVNVSNSGTGSLSFSAASDSPWLAVSPDNGIAPQSLQISTALGALTSGTYTGHITVTAGGAAGSPATITVHFAVAAPAPSNTPFWSQWGAEPQHTGMVSIAGLNLVNRAADIVYDPFVTQEKAENVPIFGEAVLTVHYQAPITDGNDVYMLTKSGSYTPCNPAGAWANGAACGPNTWNTMTWNESRFTWENGQLVHVWDFPSDWKPETNSGGLGGWEPVFHPADTPNFLYVPGAGGTVWKVDKATGTAVLSVNPFAGMPNVVAANTYVAGPLTADSAGECLLQRDRAEPGRRQPMASE
jgi:BACON domain-containing protein